MQNFKILAFFCDCTAWFVSDLVRNPNCWFSHAQAQIKEQHRVMQCHMMKLEVINMAITNVIGRCKRHDVIDVVPLFEHSLCVNSLFAYKYRYIQYLF